MDSSDSEKEEGETFDNSQTQNHAGNNENNDDREDTVSDEEFNRKYREFLQDDNATANREITTEILNEFFSERNGQYFKNLKYKNFETEKYFC